MNEAPNVRYVKTWFGRVIDRLTVVPTSFQDRAFERGVCCSQPIILETVFQDTVSSITEKYEGDGDSRIKDIVTEAINAGIRLSGAKIVKQERHGIKEEGLSHLEVLGLSRRVEPMRDEVYAEFRADLAILATQQALREGE